MKSQRGWRVKYFIDVGSGGFPWRRNKWSVYQHLNCRRNEYDEQPTGEEGNHDSR
jgi:hypothetical protein